MVVVFVLLGKLLRFREQWRDGGIVALRMFDADETSEGGTFKIAATVQRRSELGVENSTLRGIFVTQFFHLAEPDQKFGHTDVILKSVLSSGSNRINFHDL